MSKTFTAVFDGQVLRPDFELDLEPNSRYVITIQPFEEPVEGDNLWGFLRQVAGSVEAPSDWSAEKDHYLYGTPKHNPDGES